MNKGEIIKLCDHRLRECKHTRVDHNFDCKSVICRDCGKAFDLFDAYIKAVGSYFRARERCISAESENSTLKAKIWRLENGIHD